MPYLLGASACFPTYVRVCASGMMAPCDDKASQSNPGEAAARHLSLLMDVDFDTQVIQATAEYTVEIMVCKIKFGYMDIYV